nr:carbamoyltransferase C-terminal domain-containing protein [bacterium]
HREGQQHVRRQPPAGCADELFATGGRLSPHMLLTFPVRPAWRDRLGAVTHVDGTSRLQTVDRNEQPGYAALIDEFAALTGVPAVLNTSFNAKDEPIVCSPRDAIRSFLCTGLDALALHDFLVLKK